MLYLCLYFLFSENNFLSSSSFLFLSSPLLVFALHTADVCIYSDTSVHKHNSFHDFGPKLFDSYPFQFGIRMVERMKFMKGGTTTVLFLASQSHLTAALEIWVDTKFPVSNLLFYGVSI